MGPLYLDPTLIPFYDVKWTGSLASLSLFSGRYFDPETSFTQSCFPNKKTNGWWELSSLFSFSVNKVQRWFDVNTLPSNLTRVSSTMVEACKSFIFTKSSLVLKIKNSWLIFIITLYSYITLLQRRKQCPSVAVNFGTLFIYKPLWSDSEHTAAELNKNAIFLIQLNWNFRLLFLQFNTLLLRQLNVFHNPLLNRLFN